MKSSERGLRLLPGPNPPDTGWDEHNRLEAALYEYFDHKPDDPAWRALGAILGEYQRDAFVEAFDVFEFAVEWGLEVSILPKSWYNLGSTVHVVFYLPERYR